MNVYFDASALVALFVVQAHTKDARAALVGNVLIISDFAAAEFSSAIARLVRMQVMLASEATAIFAAFDAWRANTATRHHVAETDMIAAMAFVRRLDLNLRTPDAMNIATAQRCAATLVTFDKKMAMAAQTLGFSVIC